MNSLENNNYYLRNQTLYHKNVDSAVEEEKQKAYAYGLATLKKCNHHQDSFAIETQVARNNHVFTVHDSTLNDPFFWLSLSLSTSLHSRSHYSASTSSGSFNCTGSGHSGGDGKGILAVALIIAIIALAASALIALGSAISQGIDSAKSSLDYLNAYTSLWTSNEKVHKVYETMLPILNRERLTKGFGAATTLIIAGGLGVLTASAIIALNAYLGNQSFPPLCTKLAIMGAGLTGGGLIGLSLTYGVRALVENKKPIKKLYDDLHASLSDLQPELFKPYEVLMDSPHPQAFFTSLNQLYIRDNEKIIVKKLDLTEKTSLLSKDFHEIHFSSQDVT